MQLKAPGKLVVDPSSLSIIRKVLFFNAITHCLPGVSIAVLQNMLVSLLPTLPMSVNTIGVQLCTNDVAQALLEPIKFAFMKLFNVLEHTRKSVFISGPIPTFCRGNMISR